MARKLTNAVSRELRTLIQRCLYDDPADRPTPEELLTAINPHARRRETDVRCWMSTLDYPPAASPDEAYARPLCCELSLADTNLPEW